jgi:hypothetical protein
VGAIETQDTLKNRKMRQSVQTLCLTDPKPVVFANGIVGNLNFLSPFQFSKHGGPSCAIFVLWLGIGARDSKFGQLWSLTGGFCFNRLRRSPYGGTGADRRYSKLPHYPSA